MRASPDSLRRMRRYRSSGGVIPASRLDRLAEHEAGESPHLHVLADPGDGLRHELADRLVGVLHERLLEETRLGVELLDSSLDDLLGDLGRLARLRRLGARDLLLVGEDLL